MCASVCISSNGTFARSWSSCWLRFLPIPFESMRWRLGALRGDDACGSGSEPVSLRCRRAGAREGWRRRPTEGRSGKSLSADLPCGLACRCLQVVTFITVRRLFEVGTSAAADTRARSGYSGSIGLRIHPTRATAGREMAGNPARNRLPESPFSRLPQWPRYFQVSPTGVQPQCEKQPRAFLSLQ